MTTKRTVNVKQWDRFRTRHEKLLVLWVKGGVARVLDEQRGWCMNKTATALMRHRRLGRCVVPRLHKVHKRCKCCRRDVVVNAAAALRMARAEVKS